MISSDVDYSISRYAGIGHQPLPINPLKEFLKSNFLVATKPSVYPSVRPSVGRLVMRFCFCLLGATNAVCTALFYFLTNGQTL